MIEEREVIGMVLGWGTLSFFLINRTELEDLPARRWLVASLALLVASLTFSVVEDFVALDALDTLQHVSAGASGALLAWWVRCACRPPGPLPPQSP